MKQDKFSVKLKNIDTMYQFLHDAKSLSNNITAGQGIYSVDAKSLTGLLSLDLRQEIEVIISENSTDIRIDFTNSKGKTFYTELK